MKKKEFKSYFFSFGYQKTLLRKKNVGQEKLWTMNTGVRQNFGPKKMGPHIFYLNEKYWIQKFGKKFASNSFVIASMENRTNVARTNVSLKYGIC